jgi:hypothetical protein
MWHHNVDLLAYHDLDGRSGFKLALQEAEGRFFLYVAGFWHSGWSILDVTDPEHPELLRFLAGPPNTMTIQVQVADGTMITAPDPPLCADQWGVWAGAENVRERAVLCGLSWRGHGILRRRRSVHQRYQARECLRGRYPHRAADGTLAVQIRPLHGPPGPGNERWNSVTGEALCRCGAGLAAKGDSAEPTPVRLHSWFRQQFPCWCAERLRAPGSWCRAGPGRWRPPPAG